MFISNGCSQSSIMYQQSPLKEQAVHARTVQKWVAEREWKGVSCFRLAQIRSQIVTTCLHWGKPSALNSSKKFILCKKNFLLLWKVLYTHVVIFDIIHKGACSNWHTYWQNGPAQETAIQWHVWEYTIHKDAIADFAWLIHIIHVL